MKRSKATKPSSTGIELLGLGNLHAFQAPVVATTFMRLRVSAAFWSEQGWHVLADALPNVMLFESGHGHAPDRYAHNARCFARVKRERRPVLAENAGFFDFFVPVGNEQGVQAILVVGPLATRRPTSGDLLKRWRWLTGRNAHPSDPEFAHYLSVTLGTLTLEGRQVHRFERLLVCLAWLVAGRGDAQALTREALLLSDGLEETRFVDRMWAAARSMIDESTAASWLAPHTKFDLAKLGQDRLPEHALVGLMAASREESDPVDAALRRDAFQRACVDLARASDNVVCGKISEHGIIFLTSGTRSAARTRERQLRFAERATALARRRFGLVVHFGASLTPSSATLGERYEQALAAAERALAQRLSIVYAAADSPGPSSLIRQLRRQLGAINGEEPQAVAAKFERFVEAVAVHTSYRTEVARAQLEAGFDQAANALAATGALAEKSYLDMCQTLERAARDSATMSDLFAAYRRTFSELADLAQHPVRASRDRSLRRAIAFIHRHFSDPIDLPQVARVAGFSPNYFGQLFKRREQMTFEHYVRQLRIERAKQLLGITDLSTEKVGQLSGFPLRPYFYRVFKDLVGTTPAAYRRSR
jgi:AraC-like DNA-binding protein